MHSYVAAVVGAVKVSELCIGAEQLCHCAFEGVLVPMQFMAWLMNVFR